MTTPERPKRQSMLWGRSDLSEKFYAGSSSSNAWVRDLLWKRYILNESKVLNLPVSPLQQAPPHMLPVEMARHAAEKDLAEKKKALNLQRTQLRRMVAEKEKAMKLSQRPKTANSIFSDTKSVRSYRSSGSRGSRASRGSRGSRGSRASLRSRGSMNSLRSSSSSARRRAHRIPPLQLSRARGKLERTLGGGKGIKPRGSVDSRQSIRSTVSVSKLADAIHRQNASLEHNLTKSNVARRRMEQEMHALREDFQRQMAETAKMQEDQKAEILDYVKTIVKNLERKH